MSTTPSVCPRCSTPFGCGIDTDACWCADVTVREATRAAFAQYYEGCLCRDCLESLEAGRPAIPSVRAFLASQLRRKNWLRR
ncbi:MAG TPA: cysteine-rich CWC family protein [Solirubrobacteraceae bacterium]|nr:cysteine-rich CWC family protein [Solirubrobacteraceae bacterium]